MTASAALRESSTRLFERGFLRTVSFFREVTTEAALGESAVIVGWRCTACIGDDEVFQRTVEREGHLELSPGGGLAEQLQLNFFGFEWNSESEPLTQSCVDQFHLIGL